MLRSLVGSEMCIRDRLSFANRGSKSHPVLAVASAASDAAEIAEARLELAMSSNAVDWLGEAADGSHARRTANPCTLVANGRELSRESEVEMQANRSNEAKELAYSLAMPCRNMLACDSAIIGRK